MTRIKNFLNGCARAKCALALLFVLSAAQVLVAASGPLPFRLGSGEKDLVRYQECGYNATILGGLTQLDDFAESAPGALPPTSALRQKIDRDRAKFHRDCKKAADLGLRAGIGTDEVTLPVAVFEQFKKSIARKDKPDKIDFKSAAFWNLYRAKYREVLKAFPEVSFVVVRTGENYSHPEEGYLGHTVRERAYDDAYFQNMQRLINETRKVVADEFGRTLIWRTWDLGNDGFHANPKVYDRILEGVTERKGLLFSIKHVQTDFWEYNDFNPMIGRGKVDQIVEFQCAREYEGKGAFPNYMGPEHADAMKKARELGAKGVWIWNFGGGWGGPFRKSDLWVRLNIEATSRLAQNPDLSARDLAEQWAAKEFGAKAAPKVAEMLMLSSECVRKFIYIAPYAREHKGWVPSRGLLRDDIIRGEKDSHKQGVLKELYEGSKASLDEALKEKTEALELARKMRGLFESARDSIVAERGQPTYDQAHDSLVYLESLVRVMAHYVRGMFQYYQSQENLNAATAAAAKQELLQWRKAWKEYQTEIPKLPGAASLYRSQTDQPANTTSGAMADTCEKALAALGVGQ